ncbi:SusD/RagB family nutrient-binding outer membrane lipoprotein [Marivirga sp.]|uniref:SusD/RagB family nutrient-binding outer membrane lipoprotein n=1 Tax=Marivirga sp. TaxID=2018662 RepID=UPI0025FAB8E0|nr:SusD/RagB family nutrient-binding outer membrane lipoprotein [Marivirga sp.]
MRTYIKLFILGILISSVACQELVNGDEDININPNNPTSTGHESVLTTTGVGQIILQNGETSRLAGILGGTHTGIARQYGGYNSYSITTGDLDAIWDDLFIHSFRNAKLTEELATEEGISGITIGIAQVHQALAIGSGAGLYGSLPFDDLAQIDIDNPAFESQPQVYAKVQGLLDQAISNLESGQGKPFTNSDIFFDGDASAWLEVAYTLKARFYMHTKEYAEAYSAAQSGISAYENSMQAPYGTALDAANLNWQLWENETQGDDIVISEFMVSLVSPDNTESPDFTNYRGNAKTNETARYNYLFSTNDNGYQTNPADGAFGGQSTPSPMVTYQENLLILAEAGLRSQGFNVGLGHLNEFRDFMATGGYLGNVDLNNLQYDPYTTTDFDNGGLENSNGLSADDALLREILEERYVTLFSQIEIFNDVRRTQDEINVRVPVEPNTGSDLPQRFIYPQSEIDRNDNTPSPIPTLFDRTAVNQ